VAGYLFALHDLGLSVTNARTVAVTILVACGLYLVIALEAEGSRRRSTLVAAMCAALGGLYVAVLVIPATRRFFELTVPDAGMIVTAVVASSVAIAALALCGFSVRVARPAANGEPS
jgi:Kef-type K+ transport system membrane component KefB